MSLIPQVTEMVHKYAQSVGLTKEQCFNPSNNTWHWKMGSAPIEILFNKIEIKPGQFREYLRVFSPLLEVPKANECVLYKHLLTLNDNYLGVKLTVSSNNWVYATYERDLIGMDYEETKTCISDLELWADHLDDILKDQFAR